MVYYRFDCMVSMWRLLYRTRDMAVVGLVLSLLCLVVTLVSLHTYGTLLYGLHQVSRVANSNQDFSARSSKNSKKVYRT
jgi:hypothetical protein